MYKVKEDLILKKYIVTPDSYQISLKMYEKDKIVNGNVEEIFDMMLKAANGKTPNL